MQPQPAHTHILCACALHFLLRVHVRAWFMFGYGTVMTLITKTTLFNIGKVHKYRIALFLKVHSFQLKWYLFGRQTYLHARARGA